VKNTLLPIGLIIIGLLVACSSSSDVEPTSNPEPTLTAKPVETSIPLPTLTSPAYPPPVITAPDPTLLPEGYPAPPVPPPTLDPYPGGVVWIVLPVGLQCEEPENTDIQLAIDTLKEAGVTVLSSEQISLEVCQACGCPTSGHYRAQIDPSGLSTALSLGWNRE
jgi:hypothetical protein